MDFKRLEAGNTRKKMNVLVLIFVLATVDACGNNRMADISYSLGRALNRALDNERVNYTTIPNNVTYNMNVTFQAKGMGGLYNITENFMNLVLPKDTFLKEIDIELIDKDGQIDVNKLMDQLPTIVLHFSGLLALTIIGLLFAILMPLVGIIFCCCRCCGNCGARSEPFDKKHDLCKKVFLAMFLIAISTLLLFGVVSAFVSNQQLQEGIEELPKNLKSGAGDIQIYINNTDKQIETLLVKNFQEINETLVKVLQGSSKIISEELANVSNAISFTNLAEFVEGLDEIQDNLGYMKNATNELRVNASQLSDGLRRVKNDLIHALNACTESDCKDIQKDINLMNTTIDFDKLPDLTGTLSELESILSATDLQKRIEEAVKSFNSIEENINKTIYDNIPTIETSVNSAGENLKQGYQNMSKVLKEINDQLSEDDSNSNNNLIVELDYYIQEYSKYRFYLGIGESTVLLIVIICLSFGLLCGICGKRPGGYDDDCCNKGSGSRFLMMGVGVMFFFSFILMIITLVYFLLGMMSQRILCDTLHNPDSKLFTILDKMMNMQNAIPTNMSHVIQDCHANNSIYSVLKLENKLNMSEIPEYLDKFDIKSKMDEFLEKIEITEDIKIIDEEMEGQLDKLVESGIGDIPFGRFMDILDYTNVKSMDLGQMAAKLDDLEKQLRGSKFANLKMALKQNSMYLRMYQENLVLPMINTSEELKKRANKLDTDIKLNHPDLSFKELIEEVKLNITETQSCINQNGPKQIKNITKEFINNFENKLLDYIYYVSNRTTKDVGQCGPLSNVYNATLNATCDKIFTPMNGFWVCVGWCLLLFIPAIVLAVKLANLYQKAQSYPGPLVEAEYLYDAYADRDNIPLSNVPHKKGKKKKRGGQSDPYDSHGGYGDGRNPDMRSAPPRERDAPGGSSHPDTRYADMAPKHWDDYPNGGPPQYQSAPMATEYERPPPYYYPGPGERP